MSETKPLDEEQVARLQLLANGITHQYSGPDGKGGTDVLAADVRALLDVALADARDLQPELARTVMEQAAEIARLNAALAEAQRERAEVNDAMAFVLGAIKAATGEEPVVMFVPELLEQWRRKELAAAQANARTLREALVRIHQAHYDAAYSHDAQKLAVYDCMAKWAHEAYASAPADEAALRTLLENVAQRSFDLGIKSTKGILLVSKDAVINDALGASDTAKQGGGDA